MVRFLPAILLALVLPAAAAQADTTALVDRPSGTGALPYDRSHGTHLQRHALSADGCFVVFTSGTDDLSSADDDSADNVYRQNRCQPGTAPVLVNTTAAGRPAAAGSESFGATVSADGRYVAFVSDAENLHPDARGAELYAFRKDLQTGAIDLVSRASGAAGAPAEYVEQAVITGNGGGVAFTARGAIAASNATGSPDSADAYVRYVANGITYMASARPTGGYGGAVQSLDVDYNGSSVVFITSAGLIELDKDGDLDAYERRGIGTIGVTLQRVSAGLVGADYAFEAAISGDASRIAYTTGAYVWLSACSPCAKPERIDKARAGGTNEVHAHTAPFFAQTGGAPPTRVFWSTRNALDPADVNDRADIYSSALQGTDPIRLVSGATADGGIYTGDATDDLSVSVFETSATTSLAGSGGVFAEAFVRTAGTIRNLKQVAGSSLRASDADQAYLLPRHAASDDGRVVAFTTYAPGLGAPQPGGNRVGQVVARDVASARTTLVSVAADGSSPADHVAENPSVDRSGRRVAFTSAATNLIADPTGDRTHVYARDLVTRKTVVVDRTAAGKPSENGAYQPQISADGRSVVFESSSKDLPGAPQDQMQHIYRVDIATGATTLVDRSSAGVPGDEEASDPDVSADGSRVAFTSYATNLGGPTTKKLHVYVRDLRAGTTTWASVSAAADAQAASPSISASGTRVAFVGLGFGPARFSVVVRDLAARRTLTASAAGSEAEDRSPSLSRDGRRVSYVRFARRVAGAAYVRDLATGALVRMPGRLGADGASLAGDGACVVLQSRSDDLVPGSYGPNFSHVYRRCATPGGAARDTTAPSISRLRVTRRRAVTFTLSEAASTRITVARCNRKGRHCKRRVTLARAGALGANRVALSRRRIGKAGRYRVTVVATDRAGNRSRAKSVRFRLTARTTAAITAGTSR